MHEERQNIQGKKTETKHKKERDDRGGKHSMFQERERERLCRERGYAERERERERE